MLVELQERVEINVVSLPYLTRSLPEHFSHFLAHSLFIMDVNTCALCNNLSTCCPAQPAELEARSLEEPYHSQLLSGHFNPPPPPHDFPRAVQKASWMGLMCLRSHHRDEITRHSTFSHLKQNPSCNQGGQRGRHWAGGWSLFTNQLHPSAQLPFPSRGLLGNVIKVDFISFLSQTLLRLLWIKHRGADTVVGDGPGVSPEVLLRHPGLLGTWIEKRWTCRCL